MRKIIPLALAVVAGAASFAAPTLSDVKVTPMEPVGFQIDYTVSGAATSNNTRKLEFSLLAKTLEGDTTCSNGKHTILWNTATDGISIKDETVSLKIAAGEPTDGATYCVVDLSRGPNAASYPVTYLEEEPAWTFTNAIYKTYCLVLKRVNAGSFVMGDDPTLTTTRMVTLSKPFYMGVFEVTQKQWELVMGTNPVTKTKGWARAVADVSYDDIRGEDSITAKSFIGKLNARTGLNFDLPTEAQWEYTCRAGTKTKWSFGDDESKASEYVWFSSNTYTAAFEVGLKKPNPWGFYDMHGNVWEWCVDCQKGVGWENVERFKNLPYGTDPLYSDGSGIHVRRGGCFSYWAEGCSSYAGESNSNNAYFTQGFRLLKPIAGE